MNILDKNYFHYSGRIVEKDNSCYLGFTNSKIEFFVEGSSSKLTTIKAIIHTQLNGELNNARLKVFLDEEEQSDHLLILDKEENTYHLATLNDSFIHKITIVKITEAAMSYANIVDIIISDGTIKPFPNQTENRLKVEFIGDSITCGYGVYGLPYSEYNISEEDGLVTYAALAEKNLNLNARYFCVSGYGVHYKYDGDLDGVIPKIYNYTNYFIDQTMMHDFTEFIPDLYVINLGTNDSGLLVDSQSIDNFIRSYVDFITLLKGRSKEAKILCIVGTLCTNVYPLIEQAISLASSKGIRDLYSLELPYHNVQLDGMASSHPSLQTHKKDSVLLTQKIKELFNL